MNYLIRLLAIVTVFVTVTGSTSSQSVNFPAVSGFRISQDYPVYTPVNLWDYINGAADAYLSYGFSELHIAEYVKGRNRIKVEIYDHSKPLWGFGIYSLERSPGYRFVNIGGQGYFEEGLIHFFKDRYYVKVVTNSKSKSILKSLETIALRVAATLPGSGSMPSVISDLPAQGRHANEEIYINESVLGHAFLRGGLKAPYTINGNTFTLYYFVNETTEEAASAVDSYLKLAGIEPLGDNAGKFQFRDGYNGEVYLVWNQTTFAIITGLGTGMEEFVGEFVSGIAPFR